MKTLQLIIVIFVLSITPSIAQSLQLENSREIYFSMDPIGTKEYGMQYKTGLNENTALRFAFSSFTAEFSAINPSVSYQYPSSQLDIGGGIEAGLEKRISIGERTAVFYGVDLLVDVDYEHSQSESPILPVESRGLNDFSVSPGFGFKSGVILDIKNGFFAAVEISPRLVYRFSADEHIAGTVVSTDRTHAVGFDADVEAMKISIAYRWQRSYK